MVSSAFRNSSLLADFGYTEGYKTTTVKKQDKSHLFLNFLKHSVENSKTTLNFKTQHVPNDKCLSINKIKFSDYNQDTLENSLDFTREDEIFFGVNSTF